MNKYDQNLKICHNRQAKIQLALAWGMIIAMGAIATWALCAF
jgi:hypothetical protein